MNVRNLIKYLQRLRGDATVFIRTDSDLLYFIDDVKHEKGDVIIDTSVSEDEGDN